MKRFLLMFVALALILSACASPAAPQANPPTPEPTTPPTQPSNGPIPVDIPAAARAAIQKLSQSLGLPVDQIKVISTEAVQWPNGCLGVQIPGLMCTMIVVDGFKVVLEAEGRQYEYHTSQDGTMIVPATLALQYHREGGMAGFCNDLVIVLPDKAYASSCKTGAFADADLKTLLSAEESQQLMGWLDQYGQVQFKLDGNIAADGLLQSLTLGGYGSQEPDESTQQAMLTFAENLLTKLGQGQ